MSGQVTGWKLHRGERAQLLERFPPRYAEVVADHVTLEVGGKDLPPGVPRGDRWADRRR